MLQTLQPRESGLSPMSGMSPMADYGNIDDLRLSVKKSTTNPNTSRRNYASVDRSPTDEYESSQTKAKALFLT
jgi:hypothetical protein